MSADDQAYDVAIDSAGNAYVTGRSFGSGTSWDYATLKYDPNGYLLWERRYNGPGDGTDSALALAVDSAGNVYITGQSWGSGTGADFATLKYDTDGNLLWEARYDGPGSGFDVARALTIDSAGNVYVTGESLGADSDFATIKYDTNGTLLWVRRYDGPGNDSDGARALAVDGAGNVYVTGPSTGAGTSSDYATLKYDGTGTPQWVRRYNGDGNGHDFAAALAVDGAGSVYVTGYTFGSSSTNDYETLKYDTDGNLLWTNRVGGGPNSDDQATAIALDSSGNVYVTGMYRSSGCAGGGVQVYGTLKLDSNGIYLWDRQYGGGATEASRATSMACDAAGNLYVTGYSPGSGTGRDYATLKYDPDGNQAWVMRYDGPGNGEDIANALAVDSVGNVYVIGQSLGSSTDYALIKYSQAELIFPDSFSLFRGVLTGGGLTDLYTSDDSWMRVRAGITLNQAERQVQLVVNGTAPTETPTEIRLRVEAHASLNNIGQWIELWNYDTNAYELVDYMVATTVDSIVEVSITVDPGRFVEAGTKQMRAKISYKEVGIVLFFPWLIRFDQTVWVVVP